MTRTLDDIIYHLEEEYIKEHAGVSASSGDPWADDPWEEAESAISLTQIYAEDGRTLSQFSASDEFYTDDEVYYPKEWAEENCYSYEDALKYIKERELRKELQEFMNDDLYDTLLLGYDYRKEDFQVAVKDFVLCDFEDYMDWYMENEEEA